MAGEGTAKARLDFDSSSGASASHPPVASSSSPHEAVLQIKRESSKEPGSAMGILHMSDAVHHGSGHDDGLSTSVAVDRHPGLDADHQEEGKDFDFQRPIPEPLTPEPPDRTLEENLPIILEQLELRRTAKQRYESDVDVLAIRAARDAGEDQQAQIKSEMFLLRDIKDKIARDSDFACRYIYALGTDQIDAPSPFKAHYVKVFRDVVKEAEKKLNRGQKLTKSERFFLYGPPIQSRPDSQGSISNGGPVVSPRSSTTQGPDAMAGAAPDQNSSASTISAAVAPRSLEQDQALSQPDDSTQPKQDSSELPEVPDALKVIECPDVDWSRFGIVGDGLHRIHNTVRASYDRPELRQQLYEDDREYMVHMRRQQQQHQQLESELELTSTSVEVKDQSE